MGAPPKNMKRDSVGVYLHMRHDTPFPLVHAAVCILDDLPPSPSQLDTYLIDGPKSENAF